MGAGNVRSRGYCRGVCESTRRPGRVRKLGTVIYPAFAAHFMPPSESSGGATALSIILGTAIVFFLVYLGRKKWREHHPKRDDSGE